MNNTWSYLVSTLYDIFTSLMSFSQFVMSVFSYSFELNGDVVSVGEIAFGSLFVVFAIATVVKWLPLTPD